MGRCQPVVADLHTYFISIWLFRVWFGALQPGFHRDGVSLCLPFSLGIVELHNNSQERTTILLLNCRVHRQVSCRTWPPPRAPAATKEQSRCESAPRPRSCQIKQYVGLSSTVVECHARCQHPSRVLRTTIQAAQPVSTSWRVCWDRDTKLRPTYSTFFSVCPYLAVEYCCTVCIRHQDLGIFPSQIALNSAGDRYV